MNAAAPWRTGLALALTVALSYSICTVLYEIWPGPGIDFLNDLFHGMDFRRLGTPQPLTLGMFLRPLAVLSIWGFLVGSLFGWLWRKILSV